MARESSPNVKDRGAYFTPVAVAEFLTSWAIRKPSDRVLEPSFGDASILGPAGLRLVKLGAHQGELRKQLMGVELHFPSVSEAHSRLQALSLDATLISGSFFDQAFSRKFDVVVGNPPYIRYQSFGGSDRAESRAAAASHGVRLSGLASSWAAFTVHASELLADTGRLALVLPAELLSVSYAAPVRSYLLSRFKKVQLVLFERLVFPGVLEDVVLLLAEGRGTAEKFEVFQVPTAADLKDVPALAPVEYVPKGDDKWTTALLSGEARGLYESHLAHGSFGILRDWGEPYLGSVTGANGYFALSAQRAAELGLSETDLRPISPPGSEHLRGLEFTSLAWQHERRSGARCYVFSPVDDNPGPAARRYIEIGEREKINLGYKCKVRSPWWRVPSVAVPDLIFTYMNHDRPRLTANRARAEILNSVYGVHLKTGLKALGASALPLAALNTLTLLGSEVVGRAYGGGMLKHEPSEAALLPMPSATLLKELAPALKKLQPALAVALRTNRAGEVVTEVDRLVLEEGLGLPAQDVAVLRSAREALLERRTTRGKTANVKG